MCKSTGKRIKEKEVIEAIRMLRADGVSDEIIITKVTSLTVSRKYVLARLALWQA